MEIVEAEAGRKCVNWRATDLAGAAVSLAAGRSWRGAGMMVVENNASK